MFSRLFIHLYFHSKLSSLFLLSENLSFWMYLISTSLDYVFREKIFCWPFFDCDDNTNITFFYTWFLSCIHLLGINMFDCSFHSNILTQRSFTYKKYIIVCDLKETQKGFVTNESAEWWGCPRGVMVKAMDCGIVVNEFELQSRYDDPFRTNTLGKGLNPLILPTIGYIVPLLFF